MKPFKEIQTENPEQLLPPNRVIIRKLALIYAAKRMFILKPKKSAILSKNEA
jgi:hypothetical protein